MTYVYHFTIVYEGVENRIWREIQISSNSYLCQLGYTVLATFDTMAYHLFEITCAGKRYSLPSDMEAISADECLFCVKLKDLPLQPGSVLEMKYDFGCDQIFRIEFLDAQPMARGAGRAYPKVVAGEGRGIVDDVPSFVLLDIIKEIDKTGTSTFYYSAQNPRFPWDYREYSIKIDNALLKGDAEAIADGYAPFAEYLKPERHTPQSNLPGTRRRGSTK